MSQADELLNSVSEDSISTLTVDPESEPHIVIGSDRFITVPKELRRIAVQYDHDVETVTFDCPRYWDGLDMSQLAIYINYMRKDKKIGCHKATNVVVDETDSTIMHFDWTVSRHVSEIKGELKFLVCIKKTDEEGYEENHWNSELNEEMYVSEGLEVEESVLSPYLDIISQWASEVEEVKAILLAARDSGELNGATFTPYVDENGNLSWTNDKGLENPETVNIKGYSPVILIREIEGGRELIITDRLQSQTVTILDGTDGVSPTISIEDIDGGHRVTITDANGTKTVDIMDGTDGNDGVSPTVSIAEISGGHRLTITDANGTQTFDIMDGTNDISEAVLEYMNTFVYIGEIEPTSGPVLWFDTSKTGIE